MRHFRSIPLLSRTLRLVVTGSSLEEAQQKTGVHRNTLSNIERGLSDPKKATLERILLGYGIPREKLQPLLHVFERLSDLLVDAEPREQPFRPHTPGADQFPPPNPAGAAALEDLLAHPLPLAEDPSLLGLDAAEQLSRLMAYPAPQRPLFAATAAEFHSSRLAIHVCDASCYAAETGSIALAAELAELALSIADLAERDHDALRAYAWAHFGYARCLQALLDDAAEAFDEAARCWRTSSKPATVAGRLFTFEASLRLAQGRPSEALALLAEAAALGREPGPALLEIATLEESLGHTDKALAALDDAETRLVDPPLRHRFRLLYLRGLCHLDHPNRALSCSEEAITLAAKLDSRGDILRALWLHARVAAALGQVLLAEDLFHLLRYEFRSEGMLYDLAIVSLELASVLSPDDARSISDLAECFEALDVDPQASAALSRFAREVSQGAASPTSARHLAAYLYGARHNRRLPFSPSAP